MVMFELFHFVVSGDTEDSLNDPDDTNGSKETFREQDIYLPIANVARIMKNAIPQTGKVMSTDSTFSNLPYSLILHPQSMLSFRQKRCDVVHPISCRNLPEKTTISSHLTTALGTICFTVQAYVCYTCDLLIASYIHFIHKLLCLFLSSTILVICVLFHQNISCHNHGLSLRCCVDLGFVILKHIT